MDEILHADDTVLAKVLLDNGVVGKSDALLVDLSVSTLVDELANGLEVWVTVSNPWLDNLQHLESGLGHANKDTVVDLKETEKLEDLAWLWCDLVDTLDADNEDELGLIRHVEGALRLGDTSETDLLTLCIAILLNVLLGTLEDNTALLSGSLHE